MNFAAISSGENAKALLADCQQRGFVTFIYHHADPQHELLSNKFLYVYDDTELAEKIQLLKLDRTAKDLLR